ncbi:unnamed protein product, partial [Prorocentrum cordatum]
MRRDLSRGDVGLEDLFPGRQVPSAPPRSSSAARPPHPGSAGAAEPPRPCEQAALLPS